MGVEASGRLSTIFINLSVVLKAAVVNGMYWVICGLMPANSINAEFLGAVLFGSAALTLSTSPL